MDYEGELTPTAVMAAARRLKGHVLRTPLDPSPALAGASGAREAFLKLESLQRTGSFKIRGALNRLFTLDERERALGVVAASAQPRIGRRGGCYLAEAARDFGRAQDGFASQDRSPSPLP
jgi:Pyridoxal-phosphate dependent enzyme